MVVRSGFPIFVTDDLTRLAGFYERTFHAERTYAFPDTSEVDDGHNDDGGDDGEAGYVFLTLGEAHLGIAHETGAIAACDRATLWLYVHDVDTAFQRALTEGATCEAEPRLRGWGERVALIRDPDGFLVYLASENGAGHRRQAADGAEVDGPA